MTRSKHQLDSLQVGRALAAQYVVLFHANNILKNELGAGMSIPFLEAGHSGVEFFFVLSGFIMFHVHWKDIGQPAQLGSYVYKRFTRIYPVFWAVLVLLILGQICLTSLEVKLSSPANIVKAFLLVPFDGYPPLSVAWTLSHELLFYLLLAIAIMFGKRALILLCLWWGLCIWQIFQTGPLPYPLWFLSSSYNLLFGFGMLAVFFYQRLSWASALLCLLSGIALFGITISLNDTIDTAVRPIFYGLGATLMVAGGARLEMLGFFKSPRFLMFLADASYSTYLIHSLSMTVLVLALGKTELFSMFSYGTLFTLLVVFGTLCGVALHLIVERPLMRFLTRRPKPLVAMQ